MVEKQQNNFSDNISMNLSSVSLINLFFYYFKYAEPPPNAEPL